jgi:hypothetical protein
MELLYGLMGGGAALGMVGIVHLVNKYGPAVSAWWNKEKAVAVTLEARFAAFEARVKALEAKVGL